MACAHVARLAGVPQTVIDRAKVLLPKLQAHLDDGLDAPTLTRKALRDAHQPSLFAPDEPARRLAERINQADLENMTPMQALDLLRNLKNQA